MARLIPPIGVPVAAPMGWSVSPEQVALLCGRGVRFVTLLLDGDAAGRRARERPATRKMGRFLPLAGPRWNRKTRPFADARIKTPERNILVLSFDGGLLDCPARHQQRRVGSGATVADRDSNVRVSNVFDEKPSFCSACGNDQLSAVRFRSQSR